MSDNELIQLIKQNDEAAFSNLYNRHWEHLYLSAYCVLHDAPASRDIVQELFIWLWEHRHQLQINTVRAYLNSAVHFKISNYIRSGKIRDSFFRELSRNASLLDDHGADEVAEARELERIIIHAIHGLPTRCREIFLLSREEKLSYKAIALKLNISVNTVETHMRLALNRIRHIIEFYSLLVLFASLYYS